MKPTFEHHSTNACPKCGRKKDRRSKLCIECGRLKNLSFKIEELDPSWCYAFTGLFMGEGSVGIFPDKRANGSYHVRGQIKMRADEKPLMEDIYAHLGGKLYREKPRANSQAVSNWATTSTVQVLELCRLLIQYETIPAKKMKDVYIVRDFCEWRMSQPYRTLSWDAGREFYDRLLSCRVFSENG